MPKILYFVTDDWFFASHFLPMARAAASAGFEVVVATQISDRAESIRAEGFRLIEIRSDRKSLGLFRNLRQFIEAYSAVRDEKPDIVHCIALRSVVIGAIAAKLAKTPMIVIAPTGLGYLWLNDGLAFRAARFVVRGLVGSWLRGPRAHYIFENREDPLEFRLFPDDADVTIVGGSGVNPKDFPACPEPAAPPVKIALVSRMIRSKGIEEAVAAVRRARVLGAEIELNLFGDRDPSNRASLSEEQLRRYSAEPGVHWRGTTRDVARVWQEHHVALLLSYREGLPRSLVEAAASGRPIVTSDVVGCREVVRDREEGFLVPLGDIERAAQVLVELARDPSLRSRMGSAANARFHERFTEAAVTSTVDSLYRQLIGRASIFGSEFAQPTKHAFAAMPSVAILLCTFNGARFLDAQLRSFVAQSFKKWHLFVSDDGSTDTTLTVIAERATQLGTAPPAIRSGPRQGFVANFLGLACDPMIVADYFAFSDQDDVWGPGKLERAINWLQGRPAHVPAMYCSRTQLIDVEDRACGFSPLFRRPPSFRNALVQSLAGGNVIVFNQAARELLIGCGPSVQVPSHDWWTYLLVTAAGGEVYYDPIPTISYRIHPQNVVGANVGALNRLRRLQMLATGRFERWTDMNIAALTPFRPRMTAQNREIFDLFRAARKRGLIGRQIDFLRTGVYRQTLLGNLGLAVAVWIRKI